MTLAVTARPAASVLRAGSPFPALLETDLTLASQAELAATLRLGETVDVQPYDILVKLFPEMLLNLGLTTKIRQAGLNIMGRTTVPEFGVCGRKSHNLVSGWPLFCWCWCAPLALPCTRSRGAIGVTSIRCMSWVFVRSASSREPCGVPADRACRGVVCASLLC